MKKKCLALKLYGTPEDRAAQQACLEKLLWETPRDDDRAELVAEIERLKLDRKQWQDAYTNLKDRIESIIEAE